MLKSFPRFLLMLLVALMGVSFAAAQDAPPEESPVSLDYFRLAAGYVPYNTSLLAIAYTDAESLEALDSTVREVTAGLYGSQPMGLADLLRAAGFPYDDATKWVGDFIAIATSPGMFAPNIFFVIHMADVDAALAYIDDVNLGEENYVIDGDMLIVTISQDAFSQAQTLPAAGQRLRDVPVFEQLLALMPDMRYGVFAYADVPMLTKQDINYSRYNVGDGILFAALTRTSGISAAGLTYAEDGKMQVNVVSTGANLRMFEALNLTVTPETAGAEALAYIPENALMAVHGHDLLGYPLALWEEHLNNLLPQLLMGFSSGYYGTPNQLLSTILANISPDKRLDLLFSTLLGINQDEFSSLVGNDYVVFVVAPTGFTGTARGQMPVDFAAVFTLSDEATPRETFEVLTRSAQLFHIGSNGSRDMALSITRPTDDVQYGRIDFITGRVELGYAVTRFTIAISDDVLVIGTNSAVDSALAQLGQPTVAWVTAQEANLSPDAFMNVLVQPEAVLRMLSNLERVNVPLPLFAKLAGLSATYSLNDDGDQITQFNIALNDAGAMETLLGYISGVLVPVPTSVQPTNTAVFTPTLAATVVAPAATVTPPLTATPPPTLTPLPTAASASFPTEPVEAAGYDGLQLHRGEDGAFIIGDPDALLTLVVFSDWMCPHCQNFEPVVEQLVAQDLASGQFNIEHRSFVTAGRDATASASALAECVGTLAPESFWAVRAYLYDVAKDTPDIYRDSTQLTSALETQFEVSGSALRDCLVSASQLATDTAYGYEAGITGTPFVLFRGPDGLLVPITNITLDNIRNLALIQSGDAAGTSETTDSAPVDDAQATRAANLANLAATRAAPTVAP